ncbi:hypothetical protein PSACC_00198 [Paramicrosporidium saccamoebae]|uniref:EF-hand domain-containing protein n=1 Tax=Paramicrosporidium saccamoebae TaxID=1246581 RepID=A0A2H9TQG5_9FUNG|nr:hypothetical protein PSACC_00198 [Paramicrosporidium saccamoebae]
MGVGLDIHHRSDKYNFCGQNSELARAAKRRNKTARQNSNVFAMFDQRQIGEFKEAFSFIDQNADGLIDRNDLQEILTSLGRPPTEEELEGMLAELPEGSPGLNFTLFLAMMGERMQGIDTEADLLNAFEVLDERRTGHISSDLLREYFTTMGDRLCEEEFDLMLRGTELDANGHINYRHFVKTLTHAEEEQNEGQ